MSRWVNIVGAIQIDTNILEDANILTQEVNEYIKNAPEITGSEENAQAYFILQNGYNYFTNEIADNGDMAELRYQTCGVITIVGDLRDRDYYQTREEVMNFAKYIAQQYIILNGSFSISDSYLGKFTPVLPEAIVPR
jgi:hypothetical protein